MKKRDNKGFTLVELIVVLVILAILAAILVPALLGYIDKAREKQVTTNAEAAYVAAQALATEVYGKSGDTAKLATAVTVDAIKKLTDIEETFTIAVTYKADDTNTSDDPHAYFIIKEFEYKQDTSIANAKQAKWTLASNGNWVVTAAGATSYPSN